MLWLLCGICIFHITFNRQLLIPRSPASHSFSTSLLHLDKMAHLDADQIIQHSMSEDDPNGNAVSDKNSNETVGFSFRQMVDEGLQLANRQQTVNEPTLLVSPLSRFRGGVPNTKAPKFLHPVTRRRSASRKLSVSSFAPRFSLLTASPSLPPLSQPRTSLTGWVKGFSLFVLLCLFL